MANTAALLSALLACKSEINVLTLQNMSWTAKYESNAAQLAECQKQEEMWYEAYDKCIEGKNNGEDGIQHLGVTYAPNNKAAATNYANIKVCNYCELDERLNELADLDIEYETMQTMFETLLTEKQAYKQSLEGVVSSAAGDTGLMNK